MVLDLILRGMAAAALLATALRLASKHRQHRAGPPGAMLCCGLVAYLAVPYLVASDRKTVVSFLVLGLAIANPPLIWLVARGLFREKLGIGNAHLAAVGGAVATGLTFAYDIPRRLLGEAALVDLASQILPQGIALGFVLLAIVEAKPSARCGRTSSSRGAVCASCS